MTPYLLSATALVAVLSAAWAYWRTRDVFHPLLYIMPMVLFRYVWMPAQTYRSGSLYAFFPDPGKLTPVHLLALFGIVALTAGAVAGTVRSGRHGSGLSHDARPSCSAATYRLAIVLGLVGVGVFGYLVGNVGGLRMAYGRPYGGGYGPSGWARDFHILTLPAIVLLYMAKRGRKWSVRDSLLLALFAAPYAIHGILGARRGATFAVFATVGVGWYLVKRRRPPLLLVAPFGAAVGLLLLFLLTYRGSIYWGANFRLDGRPLKGLSKVQAGPGNEFVYGAGAVLNAAARGDYYWGRRFAAVVLIRPIPRQLWPTQYEDVGIADGGLNAGVGRGEFEETVGWTGGRGAAPGLFADLFVEFSWGAVVAAFVLGWGYAWAWSRSCRAGGMWVVAYTMLVAFSIFLVMQTIDSILYRFLEAVVPTALLWHVFVARRRRRERGALMRRATTAPQDIC